MNFLKSAVNFNELWAACVIEELTRAGVRHFFVSPGSRCAPLLSAAAQNPRAQSFVHFDERANAFRALGTASASGQPCAVITTSGTAAANLFPAMIEASKKKLPLIILTADRPPEARAAGAHQTIDQVKMFGDYVRWHFDMPCPTADVPLAFVLTSVDQAVWRAQGSPGGPIHINLMYREPSGRARAVMPSAAYLKPLARWAASQRPYTHYLALESNIHPGALGSVADTINEIKNGVIVVGKISGDSWTHVVRLAEKLRWPVFPDVTSGLRLGVRHPLVMPYFDQMLRQLILTKSPVPDGVLHLGGRMTSKRWYEYIQSVPPQNYVMVLNHPLRSDPFHQVTTRVQARVGPFCEALCGHMAQRRAHSLVGAFQARHAHIEERITEFFNGQSQLSEPYAARLISQMIPSGHALFVSNSMPVRDMDMFGDPDGARVNIGANRGASGIDGVIASAVGYSTGMGQRTTLLIGDLAFLHDLNSLAMIKELPRPMAIVVFNNQGGGIFSFLPVRECPGFEKYFAASHALTFSAAAELFGLDYACPQTPKELSAAYQGALENAASTLIEIRTDREDNFRVHRQIQDHIYQNKKSRSRS